MPDRVDRRTQRSRHMWKLCINFLRSRQLWSEATYWTFYLYRTKTFILFCIDACTVKCKSKLIIDDWKIRHLFFSNGTMQFHACTSKLSLLIPGWPINYFFLFSFIFFSWQVRLKKKVEKVELYRTKSGSVPW